MIKHFILNNYISREFLKIVLNMSLAFLSFGFIINLFEEINFFKDYEVGIKLPILLSTLFVPSMLYNMFPFVILLSGISFFLKIRKTDEIIAMKISGLSNFSVIVVPSVLSILLGIIFITTVNPLTSALINKYEYIKGIYELEQDYLATVTENGIWIKEKSREKIHIIRASKLDAQNLVGLTIYIFDSNNNFLKRIQAKFANIQALKVDLTDNSSEDQLLIKNYAIFGPPTILFFDSEGKEQKNRRKIGVVSADILKKEIDSLENKS